MRRSLPVTLSVLTPGLPQGSRAAICYDCLRTLSGKNKRPPPTLPWSPQHATCKWPQICSDGGLSPCPPLLPLPLLTGIVNRRFGPAWGLLGVWAARRSVTRAGHPLLLRRGDPLMVLADAAGREGPQAAPTCPPGDNP